MARMENKNSENLNLAFNEKRLMVLALIRSKGNVGEAYKINVPCGKFMSKRTYFNRLKEHNIKCKDYKAAK